MQLLVVFASVVLVAYARACRVIAACELCARCVSSTVFFQKALRAFHTANRHWMGPRFPVYLLVRAHCAVDLVWDGADRFALLAVVHVLSLSSLSSVSSSCPF